MGAGRRRSRSPKLASIVFVDPDAKTLASMAGIATTVTDGIPVVEKRREDLPLGKSRWDGSGSYGYLVNTP